MPCLFVLYACLPANALGQGFSGEPEEDMLAVYEIARAGVAIITLKPIFGSFLLAINYSIGAQQQQDHRECVWTRVLASASSGANIFFVFTVVVRVANQ